jgi:WXXGXW repeat (2 copies)
MKRAVLSVLVGAVGLISCVAGGYAYYAPAAPPPVRVEAFGAAPGPGYVWINGYWSYGGRGYAWVPGRWERAPHRGAAWVAGRWERKGSRWAYRAGHWR